MSNSKKTKGSAEAIDIHVGSRLKVRRSLLGMSQEKLAGMVGVTFQQIQKYERGTNRISAGRLYKMGKALGVPVAFFYNEFEDNNDNGLQPGFGEDRQAPFGEEDTPKLDPDIMQTKETAELVRTYYAIKDPKSRRDVMNVMKSMIKDSH